MSNQTNEPYIKLNGYKIQNLKYATDKDYVQNLKDGFSFEPKLGLNKEKTEAVLHVLASLKGENQKFGLKISLNGFFKINEVARDDEARLINILYVNGTAILFPYVRSIISMITGLDSNSTVLLPTINTTDLLRKENEENKEIN